MPSIQIIDNLAIIPLTQSEVAQLNLQSLGVITITGGGGGSGDMSQSVFATLNPAAGFVDKALMASQMPYSGLTSLPGGTTLFLRADGTFANPPGQVYAAPSISSPGLVPALQPSSQFNYYLRGDGTWTILSSISVLWTNISGTPLLFPPILHAVTHITSGQDLIPPASTTKPGLVPPLPTSSPQFNFLRGDNTWTPIPPVTVSNSGLVPNFPGTSTTFFNGTGVYSTPLYGSLASIPTQFAPTVHGSQHVLTGAYPADPIPIFSIGGSAPGLAPGSPGGGANYLRADGTWNIPPGGGGIASSSQAGLMNQLPLTNQANYYWGGDNQSHLISSISLSYSQIMSVPVFTGGSPGLVPNSSGGTVNYLRADGVYAQPAGSIVTTSSPGTVSSLPSFGGGTYYLNGLDVWTLLSSLSITYSQLTGVPLTFVPSSHQTTHITGGSDVILPPSTTKSGLVPILPSSNQFLNYLHGDASWQPIPIAGPSTSGLVPTPPNSQSQWLRGDASFQPLPLVSSSVSGVVQAFPGNTTTFLNGSGNYTSVDYTTAVSGKPLTFTPSLHASSHVTGGGDQIPVFSGVSTGLVPIAGSAGTYLSASGGWSTPSGSGNVASSETIATTNSLQGGGDLSANRTLSLVGDVTTPANSSYYGTNSGGTRGWYTSISQPQATSTTAGLVPTPTGVSTVFLSGAASFITPPSFSGSVVGYVPVSLGGSVNFLRADGSWAAPPTPGLATTSTGGIVPSLNASNQTLYFLRGDDTWQLISGLSLAYTQITGVPVFSGTTTNGLVPGATAGSASMFLAGSGTFLTPPLAASAVAGYISGLPSSSATSFWSRGDNSWQLLPTSVFVPSPWTMPAVGSSVSPVAVTTNVAVLDVGMTILTGFQTGTSVTECLMEITGISGSNLTLTNRGYAINPTSGTSIPGGLMFIAGPGVAVSAQSGFVPTPPSDATKYLDGTGSWSIPSGGGGGLSTVTTQFSVSGTGSVGSPVQLVNDVSTPGAFKFYSTNAVGTLGWYPLTYSWETSATFSMPGVGATQNITLVTNVGITVGTTIVIEDNGIPANQGFFEVISVNGDGLHIVIKNQGYALTVTNPGSGTFATNAAVTLAGPGVCAVVSGSGNAGFVPTPTTNTNQFLRGDAIFATPSVVTTSAAGYVPIAPNIVTQFLNGTGVFSTPTITTLAGPSTQGAVPILLASGESTSFLQGDNTWQAMSTISGSLVYASIPGIPTSLTPTAHHLTHVSGQSDPIATFSTTTTVSGLVPGSNNVGATFFLTAIGTWATPPSGPGNASAGVAGLVVGLISSPTLQYLRGDNSWQPISGLAVAYGNLTGTPTTFTPSAHASTHLDNGIDPIAVVAGVRTGLVPILPSSAPTTKFLRGDATWTVVPNFATNAVTPGLVVGSNSVSNVNFLRADNTWNTIQPVTTSVAGVVPVLPASNAVNQFLNGSGTNGTWSTIPFYWNITTSFTQPATSGNVSGVVFTSTTGLVAGMTIVTVDSGNVSNYYTVFSITDGTHAVLTNLGPTTGSTAAAGTVNPGISKLAGPPVVSTTTAGIVPIPPNLNTEYLDGTGNWSVPPSSGVTSSRLVNTQFSLTGGGDLSANRTLNLVGDTATPAGFSVYGTNTGGTRGWYASNSFPLASLTNAGLLLTLTGSTSNFLRADGSWSAPSGLAAASTGVSGIVTGLPATNQVNQWLRADNTWQFLPDSNVTTSSWTMPAIGSTVSAVTFTSTSSWDVGMTLFFATGSGTTCCYMEVTTVTDGTHLVLTNRGYFSNPVSTTVIPTCLVFAVSPGIAQYTSSIGYSGLVPTPTGTTTQFLRGDATFAAVPLFAGSTAGLVPTSVGGTVNFLSAAGTWIAPPGSTVASTVTTSSTFTWPAVGASTASITVASSSQMMVGCAIYAPSFGTAEITAIADVTHCVLRNNGNSGNATSGTVSIGTILYIGTAGSLATGTSSGMIPVLPADSTKVLLGNGTFGTLLYTSLGSIPTAPPLHETTHITGGTDVIGPATTSVSGLVPVLPASNGTDKWLRGDSTWVQGPPLAIATASFTWPATGGTIAVTVDSTSNMHQNMALYAPGLGVCEVTVVTDGTHMTIRNNNNTGNAGSTAGQTPSFYVGGGGALCTTTSSGDVPIGGTSNTFLAGATATFTTPPSVSASAPGYVPTAPGNAANFLNGLTGTWTTVPYSVITGTPIGTPYNTTFSSFTVPAINATVNVTVASTADFLVGETHVLTDGTLFMIGRITVIASLVITYSNQGGGGSVSGSMGAGHVYMASALGAISGTATDFLGGDNAFHAHSTVALDTLGACTDITTRNASSSQHGLLVKTSGTTTDFLGGDNAFHAHSTVALDTLGACTDITTRNASSSQHGLLVKVSGTATDFVGGDNACHAHSTVALDTLGAPTDITTLNASTSAHGLLPKLDNTVTHFLNGQGGWTTPANTQALTTSASFTVPAINVTVNVTVASASDMVVGETHIITDGTLFMVGRITTIASLVITYSNQGGGGSVSGSMGAGRVYFGTNIGLISGTATDFLGGDNAFHAHSTVALDTLGACTDITTRNSSSSQHGLLVKVSGTATDFVGGDNACHAHSTIALDTLGACTDITTRNSSSSQHGLLVKVSGTATDFVGGDNACHAHSTVALDTLGATTDITTLNASASAHGLMPKADGTATHFYSSDGTQKVIPAATATVTGLVPTPPNNTVQFLRGDATFTSPGVTSTSTNGTFTIPASGSTVAVTIVACTWPIVGQKVYISDGGGTNKMFGMITVVGSSTSITVLNTGDTGNAVSGTMGTPAGVALVDYQSVVWDKFTAMDNDPPATLYATFDVINNISTLGFNDSATWGAVFKSVLPQFSALGSGIIVHVKWASVAAVTGAAVFGAAYERMNLTFNSDHFGSQVTATTTTSGTAGVLNDTSITIPYPNMGTTVSGDPYRLQIQRIGANGSDTLVGNAEVVFVTVESGVL